MYGKSFKERKATLDRALRTLQNQTDILQTETVVKTGRQIDGIESVVVRTDATTTKTLRHVDVIMSDLKSFSLSAVEADDHLKTLAQGMRQVSETSGTTLTRVESLGDVERAKDDARKAMEMVLVEVERNRAWRKSNDRMMNRIKMQVASLVQSRAVVTHEDLSRLLRAQEDCTEDDLRRVVRAHASLDVPMIHAATAVFGSSQFRSWLNSYASSMLFVEGEPVPTERRTESTLSMVSSTTVERYLDKDPALPIWFFCGLHTAPNDPLRGPKGMMRCLILQILRRFQVPLDFIGSHRHYEQLAEHDVYTLGDCLAKLVMKLPVETVLMCIIDGIGFFEPEWEESCQSVLRHLQHLVEDEQVPVAFKLLVTSSRRSRLGNSFEPQCRLKLSNDGLGRRPSGEERTAWGPSRRPMPRPLPQGSRGPRSRRHPSGDSVKSETISELGGWTLDSEPEDDAGRITPSLADTSPERTGGALHS